MGDNIMAKQIILHYPGSYVERPHTLVFDSKEEYQEFLQKKSYKLKPNVVYGVFTLGATISTEYAGNNLKIDVIDKNDWTFNFPEQEAPEIDITVPEEPKEDKEPGTKEDTPEVKDPENKEPESGTNQGEQEVKPTEPEIKEDENNDVIIINPGDGGTSEGPKDTTEAEGNGTTITNPDGSTDNSKQDEPPQKVEEFDDVIIFD